MSEKVYATFFFIIVGVPIVAWGVMFAMGTPFFVAGFAAFWVFLMLSLFFSFVIKAVETVENYTR